jgi:predicted nucleic acid-binding Zn ribbon protein
MSLGRPRRCETRPMGWTPLPDDDGSPPRRLGEGLDRALRALGAPGTDVVRRVFDGWPEVAGEAVAAHARPTLLRDGRLVITADEPAWGTQLRYLEADLLGRIASRVGEGKVTRIEVRIRGPEQS